MKPLQVSADTAQKLAESLNLPLEQIMHMPQHILLAKLIFPPVLLDYAGSSDCRAFRNRWYAMYHLYKQQKDWVSYLLPAAVLITAGFQVYILSAYTSEIGSVWMDGLGLTIALLLLKRNHPFGKQLTIISLCVLLLAPIYWSATPLLYGGTSVLPESGPQLKNSSGGGGMFTSEVDTGLLSYLQENNTGEEYSFATLTTVTAAPYIIINTDESVMALGGFNGTDPILMVSELKKLIKEGKVKYFLLSSDNSGLSHGSRKTEP